MVTLPLSPLLVSSLLLGSTTTAGAFDISFLNEAILTDLIQSYTDNSPTTCTGFASSTNFTFDFPGTNPNSKWNAPFIPFEEGLFLAAMSHTDTGNESWTIRLGQGGNMYSHFSPDGHGETMAPQLQASAPWMDEVHQSVAVNLNLNNKAGACNGQTCPAYYNHGAGTYQKDSPYTDVPFYSQSLAKHCGGNMCVFAAWAQQAHLSTIFTSPVIMLNVYRNCGGGVIEHTEMIHNFAPENSDPTMVDQTYFDDPWTGVRSSTLPYALEPESDGSLNYQDPDNTSYLPLCSWGSDAPGGPAGRAAWTDLKSLGGYTTFVDPGLFVNRVSGAQYYLWCSKPGGCNTTNASTCMARPSDCYNADGTPKAGYTPVRLEIPPFSSPSCSNYNGLIEGYQTLQCNMHATGFGNTGVYLYASSASDPCAPWIEGGTMGLYRDDNNQGIEIPYLRHWSWSPSNRLIYFSVYSQNLTEAINLVNGVFNNTASNRTLSIRFQTTKPVTNTVPLGYNPGALRAMTFVYGDGEEYGTGGTVPGAGRRRIGSAGRDYTVFNINWWTSGARLTPGDTFSKRAFLFASDLASAKATADTLVPKVVPDLIEDTRWNPRAISIYKSGTSFDAVAASSAQGTSTTCSSASASLACSGFSTPKPGHRAFFYITCGTSTYLGHDPYFFTPGNGVYFNFPGMSNDNTQKIRSYACVGQGTSVRPTWKLIGFFDPSTCATLGPGMKYDDNICVAPTNKPSSAPTNEPSSAPTNKPSSAPMPTDAPTNKPTSQPTNSPTHNPTTSSPTENPTTSSPTENPTKNPTKNPTTSPSTSPSKNPTKNPTSIPSTFPTSNPTKNPTKNPTSSPSTSPSKNPTKNPTSIPSTFPTNNPTKNPTKNPTSSPSTSPLNNPTKNPTKNPTSSPTALPTKNPTKNPTSSPSTSPLNNPTKNPTKNPTSSPTALPTKNPTKNPTSSPSTSPLKNPTSSPSALPTKNPTKNPTSGPSTFPTKIPTSQPTGAPTSPPTVLTGFCTDGTGRCLPTNMDQCACAAMSLPVPEHTESLFGRRHLQTCQGLKSNQCKLPFCQWAGGNGCVPATTPSPTKAPTSPPSTFKSTNAPTPNPSNAMSSAPTSQPSRKPTNAPMTNAPSAAPTDLPTQQPSTSNPTDNPITPPDVCGCSFTAMPTMKPITSQPTANPTNQPTTNPTNQPTKVPIKLTPNPTAPPVTGPPTTPCITKDTECGTSCANCCSGSFYNGKKGMKFCS